MASLYTVKLFLSGRLQGWQEGYVWSQDGITFAQLITTLQPWLTLRQNILAPPYQIDALRVQLIRDSTSAPARFKGDIQEFPAPLVGLTGDATGGDSFRLAVKMNRYGDGGATAGRTFLGGFPDAISQNGGNLVPSAGGLGWDGKFNSFRDFMIAPTSNFGYLAAVPQNVAEPILGYTQVGGVVTFTTNPGTFSPTDENKLLTFAISKVNGGGKTSRVNGVHNVVIHDDKTFVLAKPGYFEPFLTVGQFVRYNSPTFIKFSNLTASGLAGHKRGKSPLASRGRRSAIPAG